MVHPHVLWKTNQAMNPTDRRILGISISVTQILALLKEHGLQAVQTPDGVVPIPEDARLIAASVSPQTCFPGDSNLMVILESDALPYSFRYQGYMPWHEPHQWRESPARTVAIQAKKDAIQLGTENGYVGTEHLLMGILEEKDGVVFKVLATEGADLAREVRRLMGHGDQTQFIPPDECT